MIWTVIGFMAATLTMFSFIPQIVKVARTKSAKDVSVITIAQLASGVFLWLIYGLARKDPVIILANAVTLVTLAILLMLYFKYGRGVQCQS